MSGIVQKNNNLHDLSPRNHSADSAVQSNNAIFRSCSKCGALYRSHKYSKSCQCRRCANIEAVETRRHREGVVKICPYCGEEFIAINGAKSAIRKNAGRPIIMSVLMRIIGNIQISERFVDDAERSLLLRAVNKDIVVNRAVLGATPN